MKLNYAALEMTYVPLSQDVWEMRSDQEVQFWERWLESHAREYVKLVPLAKHLQTFVNSSARVADIASGACCLIGGSNTVASDILAPTYMRIWRRLGVEPAIPIEHQDAAHLTYPDHSFDLVHCVNALDHSVDPRGVLIELNRVCRPGGMIYLMHLVDQGRLSNYSGLHQWNVTKDGYIWRCAPAQAGEHGQWSMNRVIGFKIEECLPGAKTAREGRHSRVYTTWVKS